MDADGQCKWTKVVNVVDKGGQCKWTKVVIVVVASISAASIPPTYLMYLHTYVSPLGRQQMKNNLE